MSTSPLADKWTTLASLHPASAPPAGCCWRPARPSAGPAASTARRSAWGSARAGRPADRCRSTCSRRCCCATSRRTSPQERLYTISDGTRDVLLARSTSRSASASTITKKLGEVAPLFSKYFERVKALLEQYRDISRRQAAGDVPRSRAFSDAEDRAVAAGLKGVRLNQDGETGYFGLVASNTTDNDAVDRVLHARSRALPRVRPDQADQRPRQPEEARRRPDRRRADRRRPEPDAADARSRRRRG